MTRSNFAIGGLLAVVLVAGSASTASAQFGYPRYQGGFGGSYIAPSGGIVTKQGFTNPFTGGTNIQKQYFNPYTGVQSRTQTYIPGPGSFGGPIVAQPPFGGFAPSPLGSFVLPAPVIGGPSVGFGTANFNYVRPGFGVGVTFGRFFP
jgi:hypothetical protein